MRLVAAALLVCSMTAHADTWIRVDADGWAERADKAPVSIAAGEHAWRFSAECAPKKVTSVAESGCAPVEVRRLTVLASGGARAGETEQTILWGTESMLAELPDSLLPSIAATPGKPVDVRVPAGEPVLARAAGTLASAWVPLKGNLTVLRASRSVPVAIDARFAGVSARHARIEITPADDPSQRAIPFRGAGDGAVAIPAVPADGFLRMLVWSDDGVPLVTTARATGLPSRIDLAKGATVTGDVAGPDARPVPNATMTMTFVVPRENVVIARRSHTDAKGRFRFSGLSNGRLAWDAAGEGFAPKAGTLAIQADIDAFHVRLDRGRALQFIVRSGSSPIDKATVTAPNHQKAKSDAKGVARLTAAPAEPFTATIAKDGFLTKTVAVSLKAAAPIAVELTRAASIRARVVHASDGSPAGPGTVELDRDGSTEIVAFGDDGRLELGALAKGRITLEIHAAGLAPFRVPSRDLATGESIDLGTIRLAAGLTLRGRVTAAESDAPIAGATVRALRTNTFTPLLSVIRHDWIESLSGDDGAFAIAGALPGPYIVVASASGRAPLVRTGTATDESGAIDIGSVALEQGHTVRISCEPATRCGNEASIVLPGADWMPLAAPMNDGKAVIAPVASGTATLRLARSASVVHEEKVSVSGADTTDVTIHLEGASVTGRVLRGGEPVGSGLVTFVSGTSPGKLITIDHSSDAGVYASENFGSSAARFAAPVRQDGTFQLDDVAPGDYLVSWSDNATQSPQRMVTISGAAQAVNVELASNAVEGTVRLADGTIPSRAAVSARQRGRETTVWAGADGTFRIVGVDEGTLVIHAASFDPEAQTDRTLEVRAGATETLQLVLERSAAEERTFTVTAGGAPVANAFVFVRSGSGMRVAMTGADGRASLKLADNDAHADMAVFGAQAGWGFWPARDLASTTSLDMQRAASILVVRGSASAPVALWSASGFPLHEALALLGAPLAVSAAAPLRIDHLPRGSYLVVSGAARRTVTIDDFSDISF
jgi:hypothetical protein